MSKTYGIVNASMIESKTLFQFGAVNESLPFLTDAYLGCRFSQLPSGVVALETPSERDARRTMKLSKPRGGDAVRLMAPWSVATVGSIGIINGTCDTDPEDDDVEITFNYSAFVGDSPEVASVSGGPGTIATPIGELRLTEEVYIYVAWMWQGGLPGAGKGRHYKRKARLWEWFPEQSKSR
jgi:hypothetical protein